MANFRVNSAGNADSERVPWTAPIRDARPAPSSRAFLLAECGGTALYPSTSAPARPRREAPAHRGLSSVLGCAAIGVPPKQECPLPATVTPFTGRPDRVRYMPGRSEIRRQLYEKAMRAFAAAGEAAKAHPKPGTPEWIRWQALCREAIDANAEYMASLAPNRPE